MVSRLETGRLTALQVKNAKQGRHGDGGGLYLVVDASGAKRWLLRIMHGGRRHDYGLGGVATVSLKEARELAYEYRRVAKRGGDPVHELRAKTYVPTFGDFADQLVDEIAPGFRNEKHVDQWRMTLTRYCASIRQKRVSDIGTEDVLECLRPLWNTRAETASRLRGRIERVLDAAKAKGHRSGENPARWRGHLDTLLPKRQRLQRGHHAALPYSHVPAFVARLRSNGSISALALEFTILTAARTGEVRGMTWAEVDEEAGVWTVPAHRMKAGREHRVPLADRALDILALVKPDDDPVGFVFPGSKQGKGLSIMALDMMLRRILDRRPKVTVHGFRSSFRDWCGEETEFDRDTVEAALAHTVGNAVERAYRRRDALEKRRLIMSAWADFLAKPAGQ